MNRLVRLYPASWRERYEDEFVALLAERPPSKRDVVDIALGAIDARLQPQVDGSRTASRASDPLSRIQGLLAIAGGLLWCATYLGPGLAQGGGEEWGGLIVLAIVLMLVSLPAPYMASLPKQIWAGIGAIAISVAVWFAGVLPSGLALLIPGLTILVGVFAGSLALALARLGITARVARRLLALVLAWPVAGAVLASMGLFAIGNWIPLAVATVMPYGLAWVAIGLRMLTGSGRPLAPILATRR